MDSTWPFDPMPMTVAELASAIDNLDGIKVDIRGFCRRVAGRSRRNMGFFGVASLLHSLGSGNTSDGSEETNATGRTS
jgi:hypothetical protein